MTICIATDVFMPSTGGIASFYSLLSEMLARNGHKLIVLTAGDENEKDKVEEFSGITRVQLRNRYISYKKKYGAYFLPGGLDAPGWIAKGLAMRDWLNENHKNFSIDIIEATDYGGLAAFFVSQELPPVAITGHGAYSQLKKYNAVINDAQSKLLCEMEMIAFQVADTIITHSPLNQLDLIAFTNRPVEFSPAPWPNPSVAEVSTANGSLLVVGGLQKIKGAITTMSALEKCQKKNIDLSLHWVGGDTFTAPGVKKMSWFLETNYPGLWNKNFRWLGEKKKEEVLEMIRKASLILLPAEWETFNLVALEAASAAKPMIITKNTGASYLFTHGHDAWIIPSDDSDALANAILHLTNNPGLCSSLGKNAADTIRNKFSESDIIEKRIAIYDKAILKRKGKTIIIASADIFLKKYITVSRKIYYSLRALLKKIIRRKTNG